jgi:hypothetical protein
LQAATPYGVLEGSTAGLAECVGAGVGELDGGGDSSVGPPPGEMVGVIPGDAELLGVADLDGDGDRVALPWGVPTFAGGGNASTGWSARAAVIMACHVCAGSIPP